MQSPSAASSRDAMRVTVKLSLADETHRVTLNGPLTFGSLLGLVPITFGAAMPKAFALVYTDNEGDLVTVSSTAEVDEARRVHCSLHSNSSRNTQARTLHFRVVPRASVKDQHPPAVRNVVDELSSAIARLASGTRESLSQSAYLERGRATVAYSAKQTRDLFHSARRELSQRLHVVQARIASELERRRSSASSAADASAGSLSAVQEPHRAARDDTLVGTQYAQRTLYDASGYGRDEGWDSEYDDDSDDDNAPVVPAPQGDDASDAETVASSDSDSDADWEVMPDLLYSEVTLLREVVPHVHVDDFIAMLRKHDGDLEAAVNELTDA